MDIYIDENKHLKSRDKSQFVYKIKTSSGKSYLNDESKQNIVPYQSLLMKENIPVPAGENDLF